MALLRKYGNTINFDTTIKQENKSYKVFIPKELIKLLKLRKGSKVLMAVKKDGEK